MQKLSSDIFLKWHLSRFTWPNISKTKNLIGYRVKNLVDECIEIQNLRLVCVKWSEKIVKWFNKNWNIAPGWKNLSSVKSFYVYDFSPLPEERHNNLTIVREFLLCWFGSSSNGSFGIFQNRPDLSYDKGRYDSYSANNLFVNNTSEMSFEYFALGYPNTRGELDNSYDVDFQDKEYLTYGEGCRNYTKNPRGGEKLELEDFAIMMNYPKYQNEKAFLFKKKYSIRYDCTSLYTFYINEAILTFLCIHKYCENCWIYYLPLEIIFLIIKHIKKIFPFKQKYFWKIGGSTTHRYMDIKNDPWRRLLHI